MHPNRRQFGFFLAATAGVSWVGTTRGFERSYDDPAVGSTGPKSPLTQPIDEMMQRFVQQQGVPGASLAVTDGGKLVYARGFGWADKEQREAVEPDSLFRIASLSKPITSVAILKLVEARKLSLADRITDLLELQNPKDSRWRSITLEHLLNHTAGWDRDKSFDGMFVPYEVSKFLNKAFPLSHDDIIAYMLQQPLDFDPGTRYAYSNFGYCLLGRAIERCSGQSYESFVQENIFKKLKLDQPRIGGTLRHERVPKEVIYYVENEPKASAIVGEIGSQVPIQYGAFDFPSMDAHGGWIASAVDMVRFAADFPVRNSKRKSRTLSPKSRELMDTPIDAKIDLDESGKTKPARYGLGWNLRDLGNGRYNAWHTGALDGTSSLMVRRHDDKCWVVLMNAKDNAKGEYLAGLIDPLIHQAVDSVKRWP